MLKKYKEIAFWGINAIGLTLYVIVGKRDFAVHLFNCTHKSLEGVLWHWGATWILLFIPFVIYTLIYRKRGGDWGVELRGAKRNLVALGVFVVAMAGPLYMGAHNPDVLKEYPLWKGLSLQNIWWFVLYEAAYLAYYVAYEGTFRGVVLFEMNDLYGPVAAIGYETAVTVLLHYNKPVPEVVAALAGGIVFGWWALKSGSWLYIVLAHFFVGLSTDFFTLYIR